MKPDMTDKMQEAAGTAGTAAYNKNMKEEGATAEASRSPAPGAGERAVVLREREYNEDARAMSKQTTSAEADPAPRGAGSGEEAVATRSRNYNESVPGAFPPLISPTPEQQQTMDAEVAEENAARLKAQEDEAKKPVLHPHASVERPILDKTKTDPPKTEAKK